MPDFWNLLEPSAGVIYLEHVMNSTFSAADPRSGHPRARK
jgi:hypothetical protein